MIQRRLSSSVVSVSDDEGEFAAPPVTPHYMLQYTFSEDARAKREAHRASHLSLASQYKREGRLVMGGAMADMSGGLAVFRSRQDAQDFAESDPYVKHGVVTRHNIHFFHSSGMLSFSRNRLKTKVKIRFKTWF